MLKERLKELKVDAFNIEIKWEEKDKREVEYLDYEKTLLYLLDRIEDLEKRKANKLFK